MIKKYKERLRQKLISDYRNIFSDEAINEDAMHESIAHALDEIILQEKIHLSEADRLKVFSELIDEFVGFGPIDGLLKDHLITEIMINGPSKVFVEKNGRTQLTGITFDSEHQLMQLVHKILAPTRRRVDELFPYTDVALQDGSRVNIIIFPLALDGPTVTIRKFMKNIATSQDLIDLGTLDKRMAEFLVASIKAKVNIIFSGATGAGKTTTLNVLSSYIPDNERIITIEDTAELRLAQEHVVRLEARQPSIEGKGGVSIRDLFKNSLRMRPDRIIVGEIRAAESLDMLQAICSGHTGSVAVIHANSPQDVIYRLETMIISSGLPITFEAIHRQIATAIHLIVHQEQLLDGSRKITHISQVNGISQGQVNLQDIFIYEMECIDEGGSPRGKWKATGVAPWFNSLFMKKGIHLPQELFNKD